MITREIDYAIRAMLYLAQEERAISASALAQAIQVPYRFLRRILLRLVDEGLLSSTRGKYGGLSLAKDASKIDLLNIIRATDVKAMVLNICLQDEQNCSRSHNCVIHEELALLQHDIEERLSNLTLAALIAKASAMKLP